MNESRLTWTAHPANWLWLAIAAGLAVGLSTFAFFPARWDALNYFDPPKRVIWSLLALFLAMTWRPPAVRVSRWMAWGTLGLALWMLARTWARLRPLAELETLCLWLLPVLLFGLSLGANRAHALKKIGWVLVVAGVVQAGLMTLQRLGWDPLFGAITTELTYKPGRMIGTIGYQNQAVDFLALTVVGALWAIKKKRNATLVAGFMFIVAGLTGNRGGIMAFVAALTVILALSAGSLMRKQGRSWWWTASLLATAALAMAGGLLMIPETAARFREVITSFAESPAVGSRAWMWRVAMDMVGERPWTGWGAGEYALQYMTRLGKLLPAEKTHQILNAVVFAREAHNDLLQFVTEFGFIGGIGLAAVAGGLVVRIWILRRSNPELASGLAFCGVYMSVAALFSFPWQTSMAGPLAAMLLGLGCASEEAVPPKPAETYTATDRFQTLLTRTVMAGFALGLLFWFAYDAWLVCSVPRRLARGPIAAAEAVIPPWGHRYRALIGAAYAAQEFWPQAEETLQAASVGYADIVLWNNLAHVQARQGKWADAAASYRLWAACGLNHGEALRNLSVACEKAGQTAEAAAALEANARLFPRLTMEEIKRLAVLQYHAGELGRAEDTLRRYGRIWSIATNAETVATFENLCGAIALARGNTEQARQWFQSALARDPSLESARRNLDGLQARQPAR